MKLLKRIGLAFMMVMVSATVSFPQPPEHRGPMPSLEEQVERFADEYSLTEGQRTAVYPIMEENRSSLRPLLEEMRAAESPMDRFSAMKAVKVEQDRYREALSQVLTPEQMAQYDERVAERRQRLKEHGRAPRE